MRVIGLLIESNARSRPRRDARISNFLAGRSCQTAQSAVRNIRRAVIGDEANAGGIEQEALYAATHRNFGHQIKCKNSAAGEAKILHLCWPFKNDEEGFGIVIHEELRGRRQLFEPVSG